ncbi:MAG: hypothetical protein R2865_11420 [Deinococcales bacterium]
MAITMVTAGLTYVVNWSCLPECQPEDISQNQDRLYHNKGDGSFSDVSEL